jgi:hypothetical protein
MLEGSEYWLKGDVEVLNPWIAYHGLSIGTLTETSNENVSVVNIFCVSYIKKNNKTDIRMSKMKCILQLKNMHKSQ